MLMNDDIDAGRKGRILRRFISTCQDGMHRSIVNLSRRSHPVLRFLSSSASVKAELEVEEASSHVYHVKLNRPDRRNTFTMELWKEMKSTFDRLSEEPKCRAIVISGNGKSFCAGIDLQQGMGELIGMLMNDDIDAGRKGRILRRFISTCQDGFTAIEVCPKPVIAAIHSHCIGAGVDLISACDIRYASSDAMFSIREVDIGMAADVGTLNRFQKIVGNDSWTRELAYTARNIGADEALKFGRTPRRSEISEMEVVIVGHGAVKRLSYSHFCNAFHLQDATGTFSYSVIAKYSGLISRIFNSEREVVEGALALAKKIAEKSPIGVQGTKEVLNHARDHSIRDSLDFVKTWNMSQMQSTDLRNGAMAAMNKQKPEFENV
ncbi:enoyl-CoA hydratase/isomerase family protein [Ostertagia ostertagi]